MRLGRFALLAGLVVAGLAVATALARSRRAPAGAAATPVVAAVQPAPEPARVDAPAVAASRPVTGAPSPATRPGSNDAVAAARIDELVQAGEIGRARDLAEDFLHRYPLSSTCQHIETLTGVHPRPPIPGE
jgi:hypothetical protein